RPALERGHGEEDAVGDRKVAAVLDGRGPTAVLALNGRSEAQPVAPDRREVLAARDQRHALAGARELRAEVAADAARAHDRDVHGMMIHCAQNMSASLERRVAVDAARA